MLLGEFKGFKKFWVRAREFWGLADALRIYHESNDPWFILSERERRP